MLMAFEAAASSMSFTKAGQELNLTQSAISHQILALEEFVGVPLFDRGNRLELNIAGRILLSRLVPALNSLEGAMLDAAASSTSSTTLRIAVMTTFAAKWLMPRLPHFLRAHPGITPNLVTIDSRFKMDLEGGSWDAYIYWDRPGKFNAYTQMLVPDNLVLVCNQEVAAALQTPADLARVTLLHLAARPEIWEQWARAADCRGLDTTRGPAFSLFTMVAQAAMAGLGAAVLPHFSVEEELTSGALIMPFPHALASPSEGYCIAVPEGRAGFPATRAFHEWIAAQAHQYNTSA